MKIIKKLLSLLWKNKRTMEFLKKIMQSPRVSNEALFEGAELCFKNAEDLFFLAKAAYSEKMYGPAVSLSVLAMEEISKGEVMQNMVLMTNSWSWFAFWRLFSGKDSHISKLEHYKGFEDWSQDLQSMIEGHNGRRRFAGEKNALKLSGLYIDFDKRTKTFVKVRVTKVEADTLIKSVENSFVRINTVRNLGYAGWLNIMKIVKLHLPSNIDEIISDRVDRHRKNQ